MDAIGCFNCLVDLSIQGPQLAKYPMENSLGLELYNASFAAELNAVAATCLEQANQCDEALSKVNYDPLTGASVPNVCLVSAYCWGGIADAFEAETGVCDVLLVVDGAETRRRMMHGCADEDGQRNPFDLGTFWPDGFPQTSFITFLYQDWVVEHLGAKISYIEFSPSVDEGECAW